MNYSGLVALSLVALVAGEALLPKPMRLKKQFGADTLSYLAAGGFCMVLACLTGLVDLLVLEKLSMGVFRPAIYAALLWGAVELKKWGLGKFFPKWQEVMLPYLPRVAVCCAVLGVAVLSGDSGSFVQVILRALLTGGIFFVTAVVALCVDRAMARVVPPSLLAGLPMYLIIAGLLMLAAVGFF
ncbi:MAG: Rnf-Nqr domain containing protein [Oscillospiraceae bacterium]